MTAPSEHDIDAALAVLAAAGWRVRTVRAHGTLLTEEGGIGLLIHDFGPDSRGYRHMEATQPWESEPAACGCPPHAQRADCRALAHGMVGVAGTAVAPSRCDNCHCGTPGFPPRCAAAAAASLSPRSGSSHIGDPGGESHP